MFQAKPAPKALCLLCQLDIINYKSALFFFLQSIPQAASTQYPTIPNSGVRASNVPPGGVHAGIPSPSHKVKMTAKPAGAAGGFGVDSGGGFIFYPVSLPEKHFPAINQCFPRGCFWILGLT
jgi:hypothetical protein